MGDFDKKKAFGIGGSLGLTGVIAILANLSEIGGCVDKTLDRFKNPENTTSVVETIDKNAEETEEESVIEQADDIEENYAEEVEEVPPTEPQPSVVYLNNMKVAESSYNFFIESNGSNMDSVGNTYAGHILIADSNDTNGCYAMYYLGGKYKTLSGTIAISDLSDSQPISELLVSCDDNVVYTTGQVGRATAPMEISLNVENCQWLKLSGITHSSWKGVIKFLLSDWKLEE